MTTLRIVGWRVVDARDGSVLHGAVFTESYANELCEKAKRKCPSAMVEKLEAK